MRSNLKTARSATAVSPATPQLVSQAGGRYRLVRSLFARKPTEDSVATKVHFDASPEAVWNRLIFFEEVPGRPPFILRLLLPHPVRSEGDKSDVGAAVQCTYKGGDLVKRITEVEPPFRLRFEVVEQRLGIGSTSWSCRTTAPRPSPPPSPASRPTSAWPRAGASGRRADAGREEAAEKSGRRHPAVTGMALGGVHRGGGDRRPHRPLAVASVAQRGLRRPRARLGVGGVPRARRRGRDAR